MIRKRTGDSSNLVAPYSYAGRPYALWPMPGMGQGNVGWGSITDIGATALTMTGMAGASINGTASSPGAVTGGTRSYINWVSAAATIGQFCGPAWSVADRARGAFYYTGVWRCVETVNLDFWFGISSIAIQGTTAPTTATPLAADFACFAWDTSVSANIIVATGDGANMSGTVTSYTPVTQHEYSWVVDYWTEFGTAVNYQLYDITTGTQVISARKTSNLPSTSNTIVRGWGAVIMTRENVVKNLQINSVGLASKW